MIQITADTRRAVVTNKELLTVGSAGIQVEFTLSEDWDGLAKLAVFRVGDEGTKVDVALGIDLTCVVPPEVLLDEGEPLFIGIYGANESGSVIIPTIWASAGVVKPGTEPNTPATAEPTPVIWAQILSVAEDAEQTAAAAMSNVEVGLQELSGLENTVQNAEDQRQANELVRIANETERVAAETERSSAENSREVSETTRLGNETTRQNNETARVAAETARASAETSRASAEEERAAAEAIREANYATYVEAVSGYADAASTSATAAAGSATSAANAASAASTSAGQAASSASSASTSASQASSSASSASTSATTASNAATTATTKAGEAAASATAASGSATSAASAKTAAEAAQTAAETAAALMQPAATSADVGKALIAKTVSGGKVTEYEYGDVGGGDAGDITYDDSETYAAGSIGAEVSNQKNAISEIEETVGHEAENITVSEIGDIPSITYKAYGRGYYSRKLSRTVKVSRIKVQPIGADNFSFSVYTYNGNYDEYGRPSTLNPSNSAYTLIKSGTVVSSEIVNNILTINFDEVTLSSDSVIVLYVYNGSTKLSGGGGNYADYQQGDYNKIIFSTTASAENPFNMNYSIGSASWISSALYLYYLSDTTGIIEDLADIDTRLTNVENEIGTNSILELPEKFDLIAGDTFELFYKGISKCIDSEGFDYELTFDGGYNYGKAWKRKWEWTPSVSDIGEKTLSITVRGNDGKALDTKTVSIVVHAVPTSPASEKVILCVGDSLSNGGVWCSELRRRLTASNGTPEGYGLTNIEFIGTNESASGCKYEGYGGWTFESYLSPMRSPAFMNINGTFDKTDDDQHSVYKDTNDVEWKLETIESNKIKIIRVSSSGTLPTSGTLTWVSGGINHGNIVYSSSEQAPGNPFWNDTTNANDFTAYAQRMGVSQIDHCIILLGWNSSYYTENTTKIYARQFINSIRSDFPNCEITLLGLELPARNGLANNYGISWKYFDKMSYVYNLNKWYADISEEFEGVEFANVCGQYDTEYNMPTINIPVNTRNSTTERVQSNGVHPNESGYFQIADAVLRSISHRLS